MGGIRFRVGFLSAAAVAVALVVAESPAAAYCGLAPEIISQDAAAVPLSAPVADPAHAAVDASATQSSTRSDQLLFLILAAGFFILWHWYRKESDPEYKLRLAAASALASVLFLAVTPAMPWLLVQDPSGHLPATECLLGQEAECAAYAPLAYGDRARLGGSEATLRAFELQRWQVAAGAVQIGQVLSLALLLPALIWLIVVPRNRAAQAATAVGASAAAFTALSVLFFRAAVPTWIQADLFWTADLALMTAANIVIAAILVVKHSFGMLSPPLNRIPPARARAAPRASPRPGSRSGCGRASGRRP